MSPHWPRWRAPRIILGKELRTPGKAKIKVKPYLSEDVHSKDRKHNISPEVILNIVLDLYRRCGDRRGNRTRGQGAVWFRGGRPGQASHRKRPQVCRESCSRSSSRQVKFTRNVDLFLVTHAKHENISSSVFIDVCKRIMRCAAAFHFFTFMLFVFSNIHSVVRSISHKLSSFFNRAVLQTPRRRRATTSSSSTWTARTPRSA